MPKCPYCSAELEIKLTLERTAIDDEFKEKLFATMEEYGNVEAELAPFMKGLARKNVQYGIEWARKYYEHIDALNIMYQTCVACDTVINTEIITNVGTTFGFGSQA